MNSILLSPADGNFVVLVAKSEKGFCLESAKPKHYKLSKLSLFAAALVASAPLAQSEIHRGVYIGVPSSKDDRHDVYIGTPSGGVIPSHVAVYIGTPSDGRVKMVHEVCIGVPTSRIAHHAGNIFIGTPTDGSSISGNQRATWEVTQTSKPSAPSSCGTISLLVYWLVWILVAVALAGTAKASAN